MALMTSTDVLKINNSEELVGLIDDAIASIPEINFFQASPVTRNAYQTLALDGLPTVGFRDPSALREFSTATIVNKSVQCKYLDASWTLPVAVAQQSDWGADFAKSLQARSHLRAAFVALAKQIWYGVAADASGFVGLDAFIEAVKDGSNNQIMVVDANPNESLSDCSTVYAVRTGIDSTQLAWGSEGRFDEGEINEQMLYTQTTADNVTTTKGAWHYAQKLGGWVGLQVTSKFAAAKIKNLSATASKKSLTDSLLYDLIEKFPAGLAPNGIFMSKRSLSQLRKSRTATNATGAPAPYPTEFEGIPIYVTDSIVNNGSSAEASGSGSGSGSGEGEGDS